LDEGVIPASKSDSRVGADKPYPLFWLRDELLIFLLPTGDDELMTMFVAPETGEIALFTTIEGLLLFMWTRDEKEGDWAAMNVEGELEGAPDSSKDVREGADKPTEEEPFD
jgi:hypothetical protein